METSVKVLRLPTTDEIAEKLGARKIPIQDVVEGNRKLAEACRQGLEDITNFRVKSLENAPSRIIPSPSRAVV